jgi:hypothetical protein
MAPKEAIGVPNVMIIEELGHLIAAVFVTHDSVWFMPSATYCIGALIFPSLPH